MFPYLSTPLNLGYRYFLDSSNPPPQAAWKYQIILGRVFFGQVGDSGKEYLHRREANTRTSDRRLLFHWWDQKHPKR